MVSPGPREERFWFQPPLHAVSCTRPQQQLQSRLLLPCGGGRGTFFSRELLHSFSRFTCCTAELASCALICWFVPCQSKGAEREAGRSLRAREAPGRLTQPPAPNPGLTRAAQGAPGRGWAGARWPQGHVRLSSPFSSSAFSAMSHTCNVEKLNSDISFLFLHEFFREKYKGKMFRHLQLRLDTGTKTKWTCDQTRIVMNSPQEYWFVSATRCVRKVSSVTALSALRVTHRHKRSTEYMRCRPPRSVVGTASCTSHTEGSNWYENIICFDNGESESHRKRFNDLQNIYSVHSSHICVC